MELVTMPLSQRVASEPVMRRKARSSRGKMAALVRMAANSDFREFDIGVVRCGSLVQGLPAKTFGLS